MKAVAGVLGGLGITEKKAPVTSSAATTATEEEKKKAKTARSALLQTEGGIVGQELQPGMVSKRDTLFGN